jgi:hypothetical protein
MSVPAVAPSQLATVAVPAVAVVAGEANHGDGGRKLKRTVLALTQRASAVAMDVVEEIPIDLDDLEDDPAVVTEALGRVNTAPYRVTIGTGLIEGRAPPSLWLLAFTVAGLALVTALLLVG